MPCWVFLFMRTDTFFRLVREYKEIHNLSYPELSKLTGMTIRHLPKWIDGDAKKANKDNIARVCIRLGLNIDEALDNHLAPSRSQLFNLNRLAVLYKELSVGDPMSCYEVVNLAGLILFNLAREKNAECAMIINELDNPRISVAHGKFYSVLSVFGSSGVIWMQTSKGFAGEKESTPKSLLPLSIENTKQIMKDLKDEH